MQNTKESIKLDLSMQKLIEEKKNRDQCMIVQSLAYAKCLLSSRLQPPKIDIMMPCIVSPSVLCEIPLLPLLRCAFFVITKLCTAAQEVSDVALL